MKKHSFLFCLLLSLITLPQFALGQCSRFFPKGYNSPGIGRQAYIEAVKGSDQFWGCGNDEGMCDTGDVVPQLDTNGKIIALYYCDRNGFLTANKFNDFSVNIWCTGTEIRPSGYTPEQIVKETSRLEDSANTSSDNENLKGIEAYYSTKDAQDTSIYDIGNITVFNGTNYCVFAKCKSGYLPNSEKNGCELDERETNCINTGGTWSGSKCNCAANKNIKTTDNLVCECISTNYEWKSDKKQGCKPTAAAQQRINAEQCTKSGGRWSNNDCVCDKNIHLEKIGKVCKCKDGYEYIDETNTSQGCKMTAATQNAQDKDKCEKSKAAGQPVKWDGNNCNCGLDGQYEIIDTGEIYECKETEQYSACKKLESSNVAYWYEGTCHCKDTTKQFRNGNCNTNTDAYQQSLDAAAAVAEIEQLGKELNDISATFDRSKWRDADGNFNTARLASDSVAAVVLGTAGGLISSKVIKKKQVENGFEDIKCTIGSQEVANWGDEFQVGIQ